MSRVAKNPVTVPAGVEVKFGTEALVIKGKNGELSFPLHSDVAIEFNDGKLAFVANNSSKQANAMSGTARALVSNMVKGVSEGFEK
ncbi:50S ribosomal protein L6, partial [Neisseria meningitidis]